MVLGSTLDGVKFGRLPLWWASSGIPGSRRSANATASLPSSSSCARKMKLHCTEQSNTLSAQDLSSMEVLGLVSRAYALFIDFPQATSQ